MRDFEKNLDHALEWEIRLLENKKKVYALLRHVLPILENLDEKDRMEFFNRLQNYFCADCGSIYDEDDVLPDNTYGCNCIQLQIIRKEEPNLKLGSNHMFRNKKKK